MVMEKSKQEIQLVLQQILEQKKSLFGDYPTTKEINVGFTNTIFSVDDKFIIKICTDEENEQAFKREINFYLHNKDNPYIPTLIDYSIDSHCILS